LWLFIEIILCRKDKIVHLTHSDKSNKFKMNIGERIRELRERQGLYLRQVAAALEVDTGYVSKFESGEKIPQKKHIKKLSELFKVNETELLTIWLSDKLIELLRNEPTAHESLKLTIKRLKEL
jgi:transcriptional regulator with XRE-family HTH domain